MRMPAIAATETRREWPLLQQIETMASVTGADDGLREVEQNLVGDTMTSGLSSHRLARTARLHRRWSIHRPVDIRQCFQRKLAQSFCARSGDSRAHPD